MRIHMNGAARRGDTLTSDFSIKHFDRWYGDKDLTAFNCAHASL